MGELARGSGPVQGGPCQASPGGSGASVDVHWLRSRPSGETVEVTRFGVGRVDARVPIEGARDDGGAAGRRTGGDLLVYEGHDVVGQADRDLDGHTTTVPGRDSD